MSKQRKMILIAAAVGVISMFLPWWSVSVSVFGNTAGGDSINGMRGAGIMVFFCFVAAGALSLTGNQTTNLGQTNWLIALIAGGLAALIAFVKFVSSPADQNILIGEVSSNRSIGLYLALIAAIGIMAFAFMYRSAGQSLQSGFDSLKGDINRKMNTNTTNSATTAGTATTVSNPVTDDPTRPVV